jgi:hypothetical protein
MPGSRPGRGARLCLKHPSRAKVLPDPSERTCRRVRGPDRIAMRQAAGAPCLGRLPRWLRPGFQHHVELVLGYAADVAVSGRREHGAQLRFTGLGAEAGADGLGERGGDAQEC